MLFQTSTSVLLGSTTVMLMLLVLTLLEVLPAPATLVSLVQERLAPVSSAVILEALVHVHCSLRGILSCSVVPIIVSP